MQECLDGLFDEGRLVENHSGHQLFGNVVKVPYGIADALLNRVQELITACACAAGCPSCVGAPGQSGIRVKEAALAILDRLGASTCVRDEAAFETGS